MSNTKMTGVVDDPQIPCYTNIEKWSANYTASIGIYGSYGHTYATASAEEFMIWDIIVTNSNYIGIIHGDIYIK